MGTIREKENALFSEWKKDSPDFICDGLVNEDSFLPLKRKVIFVLKESYDNTTPAGTNVDWDLRLKLPECRGPTWTTVMRWAYGLQNLETEAEWQDVQEKIRDPNIWAATMQSIGSMNIKKVPSRTAITDSRNLWLYAEHPENKEFLRRQWLFYGAHVTVCGGTEPFARLVAALGGDETGYTRSALGVIYWPYSPQQLIIQSCHPSARFAAKTKYLRVVDTARDYLLKAA